MHTISSYRGNRPTHKHTNRTDYNKLRRSLARSVTTVSVNYDSNKAKAISLEKSRQESQQCMLQSVHYKNAVIIQCSKNYLCL